MSFTVAIIGRPNVGKSTLFNRLVGRRLALVDDAPGVTRDRREGEARLGDLRFTVIDTAGLEEAVKESLAGRMRGQTDVAIAGADVVLLLIDARAGLTPEDRNVAQAVRRSGTPAILLANKSEGRSGVAGAYEAYELGLGEPVAISAEHGEGLADLYDALSGLMPQPDAADEDSEDEDIDRTRPIRIAVVGRPNAGKSTLINRLLGEERLLTGPEAGITRDAIGVRLNAEGRDFLVYDTAGLRRPSRIEDKLEKLSVSDALEAVRFAEVVIVLMDYATRFEEQDLRIADLIEREGRAVVIGMNKWDLVEPGAGELRKLREEADHWLPQIRGVPVVALSGRTGFGLDQLMRVVLEAHAVWNKRVPTPQLNRWLEEVTAQHGPPAVSGRRIRLNYLTQSKARPPTFVLFCTRSEAVPDDYRRYLVNSLRDTFDFPGTPMRLTLREKNNPYAGRKKEYRNFRKDGR